MKKICFVFLFFIASISIAISASVVFTPDWQTADRSSVGIAPDPATETAAIVHVYAARAFSWRSLFAVHTWLATKDKDAKKL